MKNLAPFFVLLFIVSSCKEKSNYKYLPESIGQVQSILVVMEEDLWESAVGDSVRKAFTSPIKGLAVAEPAHHIQYIPPSVFKGTVKQNRTVLAVGLDSLSLAHIKKDVYARSSFNSLVKEQRSGADLFYFDRGDKIDVAADLFSSEITELIMEHGGKNMNLGLDKGMIHGIRALEAQGFEIMDGEECTEKCRSIKGPDEILAMKCASHSCELSIHEMQNKISIGMSEDAIWAELHKSNIARGGEWIETRLLTTGPRTNPWFQECGPRQLQNNEILAFDTDLIGCYGFCIDVSRTWWIGSEKPRADMVYAMQHAHEHIMTNMEMLKPDTPFRDLTFNGHQLDSQYDKGKYSCRFHGVGLCDEWPLISYSDNFIDGAFDYKLKAGMVLCVEALVSPEKGDFSIKLEDQVLVTEDGFENITKFPFCPHLMGVT